MYTKYSIYPEKQFEMKISFIFHYDIDISNLWKINNASMHNIFIVPMVPEEEETWRCISFPHNFPNSYYQDGYIWLFCIQITYLFGSLGIHNI